MHLPKSMKRGAFEISLKVEMPSMREESQFTIWQAITAAIHQIDKVYILYSSLPFSLQTRNNVIHFYLHRGKEQRNVEHEFKTGKLLLPYVKRDGLGPDKVWLVPIVIFMYKGQFSEHPCLLLVEREIRICHFMNNGGFGVIGRAANNETRDPMWDTIPFLSTMNTSPMSWFLG